MTDFRALCAELLSALESEGYAHWVNGPDEDDLCLRARAALAQPEPEGPSIEDVEELCEEHCFNVEGYESIECLQGLINEAIARWGHQPAPPADGEVAECAAELLQRQALVPVSERLPGPEDCDAEERCWLLAPRWILPPCEMTHWLPAHALPMPEVSNG